MCLWFLHLIAKVAFGLLLMLEKRKKENVSLRVSVIKVFLSIKSPLQYDMKIAYTKKGILWGKIHVL